METKNAAEAQQIKISPNWVLDIAVASKLRRNNLLKSAIFLNYSNVRKVHQFKRMKAPFVNPATGGIDPDINQKSIITVSKSGQTGSGATAKFTTFSSVETGGLRGN